MAYYRRHKPTPQQEVKLNFATGSLMILLGAGGVVIDIILLVEIISSISRGDTKNAIACGAMLLFIGILPMCLFMGIGAVKEGIELKKKLSSQKNEP